MTARDYIGYDPARYSQTLGERFVTQVRVSESGCWEWQGSKGSLGYGYFYVPGRKNTAAYRYAYEMVKGPIPKGLEIDHICRNPSCVYPAHLEAVTHRENILRSPIAAPALNAAKTHCDKGHEFTPENTYRRSESPEGAYWRGCLTCKRETRERFKARHGNHREAGPNRVRPKGWGGRKKASA